MQVCKNMAGKKHADDPASEIIALCLSLGGHDREHLYTQIFGFS